MGAMTVYSEDPVKVAADWESRGARWLHLVDLDKATGSSGDNRSSIEKVIRSSGVSVEVGGGVRSFDEIRRWIDVGAERVCIGTRSLDVGFLEKALGEFGERLVVSLDARGSEVQVEGWRRSSGMSIADLIDQAAQLGAKRVMYTDIERDGTLSGPNLESLKEVLERAHSALGVVASGGVKSRQDVAALAQLAELGLEGVVIGRALYSGSLSLEQALQAAATAAVSPEPPSGAIHS